MGPELLVFFGIAVLAQLMGSAISSSSQQQQQRENQAWSEKMYEKDFQNQKELQKEQNEYNSIPNQVLQQLQGGKNPDYTDAAFQPSAGASLPSAMNIPAVNSFGSLFKSGLGNMFTQAVGTFQQSLAMASTMKDMQVKQTAIDEGNRNTAMQFILDTISPESLEKGLAGGVGSSDYTAMFDAIKASSSTSTGYFKGLGFSSRQAKAISRQVGRLTRSPEALKSAYDNYVKMRDSAFDYDLSMGSAYRRDPMQTVTKGTQEFIRVSNRVIEENLKRDEYKAVGEAYQSKNDSDYNETLANLGYGKAKAESDYSDVENVSFDRFVRSVRNDIVNNLLKSDNEFVRSLGVTMYFQDHSDAVKEIITNYLAIKYPEVSARLNKFVDDTGTGKFWDNPLVKMTGPGALMELFR